MRTFLPSPRETIIVAYLLGTTLGVAPAAAWTEFTGGGYVSDFSPECAVGGWQGLQRIAARMAPAGLRGNHADWSLLSFFHDSYTQNFVLPASLGDSFVSVGFSGIGFGLNNPDNSITRARIFTALSDPLRRNSGFVTVFGEFENFNDHIGCTAQFGVAMHRNPD